MIYKFVCKDNEKIYIGKTRNELSIRIASHKRSFTNIKDRNYNVHFYRALRKYGWDNFDIEIVETIEDNSIIELDKKLYELEIQYIASNNSYLCGYNSDKGGIGCCGMKHSDDTKRKISVSNMGKTMSQESKLKMKETALLRMTEDRLERLRNLSEQNAINNQKSVEACTKEGIAVRRFNSAKEGSLFYDVKYQSSVTKCCKNKIKYSGNFPDKSKIYWKYEKN